VAKQTSVTIHRIERVLAFMIAGIVGLSIVAFLAVIIATASGLKGDQFTGGFWQTVAILPGVGLPLGFLSIVVLIIISGRRRSREAQAAAASSASKNKTRK
jgi:uncharacterized membrane protein